MKVLHVIPSIAARDGGPSEAVIHLCRALAANGIEVDLAFTMAHGDERDVQPEFAVKRTFALSNGVDEAMFETSFAPRDRTVLFVGRLDRKKNLPTLIEAFACAASPGWRLVIAGEGDSAYETSLRSLTADLDAAVEFVGWVHGECKRE